MANNSLVNKARGIKFGHFAKFNTLFYQFMNSMMPSIQNRTFMTQNVKNDISKDSPIDSPRSDM